MSFDWRQVQIAWLGEKPRGRYPLLYYGTLGVTCGLIVFVIAYVAGQ